MVSVLDAIRHDRTLPPIEVVEAISNLYGHRLYHGRYRLAASIAVGFSLVPAVVVRDLDEIKRAEAWRRVEPRPRQDEGQPAWRHFREKQKALAAAGTSSSAARRIATAASRGQAPAASASMIWSQTPARRQRTKRL
jgi:hypothetical protein